MKLNYLQSPPPKLASNGAKGVAEVGTAAAAPDRAGAARPTGERSRIAAHLSEQDYRAAVVILPELAAFRDYEDWLDFRTGSFWGLEMAGITVEVVAVDLAKYEQWLRGTRTPSSISALDRFVCFCREEKDREGQSRIR